MKCFLSNMLEDPLNELSIVRTAREFFFWSEFTVMLKDFSDCSTVSATTVTITTII